MSKVILYATPVFMLLIALEFFWSRTRFSRTAGQMPYRTADTIASISLGMVSQLTGALGKFLTLGIYVWVFDRLAVHPSEAFWNSTLGWVTAFVIYDLCYYWLHRAGHVVAVFWAAHVVHHQSQHYNLSTALRQSGTKVLSDWVFFVPLALLGVPPLVFAAVAITNLLYQFWVHTEQIGSLGWFDRWFCSPSNHRVHHAVNDDYIDKNYGGVLMLWDHLFGTFQAEKEACVYGTRSPLNSCDPLWANLEVYWHLLQTTWRTPQWGDKLQVWLRPPGWQSAAMAQMAPQKPFQLAAVTLYNPVLSTQQALFAGFQFVLALAAMVVFGLVAPTMSLAELAIAGTAIGAGIWATGRFMQGNLGALEVLAVECAALACVSSIGMLPGYMLFKPLPMVIAIVIVAARAYSAGYGGQFRTFNWLLISALAFSLLGDVLLMLPGDFFIHGLAAFLVAHLFYLGLLRLGQRWFPSRTALLCVVGVGAAMYGVIWSGLGDGILKIAVAAYVTVIALMASQALGRATVLRAASARWVGAGACIFMLSDALIAINKFVTPLPLAGLWILATYFLAQLLIVHNAHAEAC